MGHIWRWDKKKSGAGSVLDYLLAEFRMLQSTQAARNHESKFQQLRFAGQREPFCESAVGPTSTKVALYQYCPTDGLQAPGIPSLTPIRFWDPPPSSGFHFLPLP